MRHTRRSPIRRHRVITLASMTGPDAPRVPPGFPDPSEATIAFVDRITGHRQEILDAKISGVENQLRTIADGHKALVDQQIETIRCEVIGGRAAATARLDAMDSAARVLADEVNRAPTRLELAVRQINDLQAVKFKAVDGRFELNDKQTVREKAAADLAVKAAFDAADKAAAAATAALTEAIAKSEKNTAETIKTNAEVTGTGDKALDDKISIANDRMTRLEGTVTTIQAERATSQTNKNEGKVSQQIGIGALGLLVAVAAVIITIIVSNRAQSPTVVDNTGPITDTTVTVTR